MNFTPTTTPQVVRSLFPSLVWDIPSNAEKTIYLTFDDGPTPEITEWTLDQLRQYNAQATFFCIGKNVEDHPKIFQKILQQGHGIGNHTQNHVKGWKTRTEDYIDNISTCNNTFELQNIKGTKLFRPPYGQIKPNQIKALKKNHYKIVMWSVLSIDWDQSVSKEKCLKNVIDNTTSGSIVVFHDSKKAAKNMQYALPKVLEHFSRKGYLFKRIPE